MSELWVFEISESQRCFHVDTLVKSIESNLLQAERYFKGEMRENEIHDYRPLFVGTHDQVWEFAKEYRQHITEIDSRHADFGTLERMAEECGVLASSALQ